MAVRVIRYICGYGKHWKTSNEERSLFLRFVSGRSRLPTRVSEISQQF